MGRGGGRLAELMACAVWMCPNRARGNENDEGGRCFENRLRPERQRMVLRDTPGHLLFLLPGGAVLSQTMFERTGAVRLCRRRATAGSAEGGALWRENDSPLRWWRPTAVSI